MTLTNRAYLEIDDGAENTATFEFHRDLEETLEGQKTFIMGDRGRFLQEIADNAVGLLSIAEVIERRTGFTIDGGSGSITRSLAFIESGEDVRWGDGDGGTGGGNVTLTDASGAGVDPLDRRDVLAYWLKRTRTDSLGPQARLHWGQWTDGNVSGVSGVSAAAQNQPLPVSVLEWSLPSPDRESGASSFDGRIDLKEIALFPSDDIPGWVQDAAAKIADQLDGVND